VSFWRLKLRNLIGSRRPASFDFTLGGAGVGSGASSGVPGDPAACGTESCDPVPRIGEQESFHFIAHAAPEPILLRHFVSDCNSALARLTDATRDESSLSTRRAE